jgi:hypothetical protein
VEVPKLPKVHKEASMAVPPLVVERLLKFTTVFRQTTIVAPPVLRPFPPIIEVGAMAISTQIGVKIIGVVGVNVDAPIAPDSKLLDHFTVQEVFDCAKMVPPSTVYRVLLNVVAEIKL